MKLTWKRALGVGAVLALALTGCSSGGGSGSASGSAKAGPPVLRVAMGSPGEAQIKVWDAIARQFETEHAGVKVEMNYQDDDLYQTIGLPNLLNGRNAPDIYFEWVGHRLETRVKDGFAADLSAYATKAPLSQTFTPAQLDLGKVGGKQYLIPHTSDVTNVLWFNKKLLADAGVTPPTTWDELLAACDTLNGKGITPIASGNKDLWAAGNFLAHLSSRIVGEQAYDAALSGSAGFDAATWKPALDAVVQLKDHKCVNPSANAITDNEGAQLFFRGKAAMHPIGSWLVSWALDEAPKLDFDYVNLPSFTGGKGNQDSVIAVTTGHVVNAKSANIDLAVAFLALVNSPTFVDQFVKAETTPIVSIGKGSPVDARSTRLSELTAKAPVVVNPPDTGYDLKRAEAFYRAVAEVLGGKATPDQALATLAALK
ncbi:MAG: extracellular solute-binding protein [Kineosporiaceae bacterium]